MTASAPRPTGDDVLRLVQEAAAVEREAAALIADKVGDNWEVLTRYSDSVRRPPERDLAAARVEIARAIAAQIRARSNPK